MTDAQDDGLEKWEWTTGGTEELRVHQVHDHGNPVISNLGKVHSNPTGYIYWV